MPKYEVLSKELTERMEYEKATGTYVKVAFDDSAAIRRDTESAKKATVMRPEFIYDSDNILYCPYYNRYTDKTQVFSLYKNDDITRRSLHVQLVSRIARTIGRALNLNLDLIEAISLGHDIGHTPFAHSGERYLDELFSEHAGRHFSHSIQSVRVLDSIFPYNLCLQTLDGIASHNGEFELDEYRPHKLDSFDEFDDLMEKCYVDARFMTKLVPSTLEGCVVRISDIIAYLGKDRQDAVMANLIGGDAFVDEALGSTTPEIVNNMMVNIIENSYGKPFIRMDEDHFRALQSWKRDNYSVIYNNRSKQMAIDDTVKPMMCDIYERLLSDLKEGRKQSPIFTHHIDFVNNNCRNKRREAYESASYDQLIVDYIASMTDDYFIDLHRFFFPHSKYKIEYKGYFD